MSIAWAAPLALIGLTLIALPIAIHLFVRQPVRELKFPSLRFLRETQLSAFRRRRIEDAALLACRAGIVAAAVMALAGPTLRTEARTAAQAARVSRAVVVTGGVTEEAVAPLEQDTFRFARWQRASAADSLRDAARWLNEQPRSSREIVIAGALRRGDLAAVDLAAVPPDIGVRFVQTPATSARDVTVSILTRRGGALMRVDRQAQLADESTRVSGGNESAVSDDLVQIVARPADSSLANAALDAALAAGVPWRDFSRRVTIVWPGADEFGIARRMAESEVVRMPVPEPRSSAADAVMAALVKVAGPEWMEPALIPAAQLDAWSRRPGGPFSSAPPGDDSDHRYLWALVLLLLGVEWVIRRRRSAAVDAPDTVQEARVA